MTAIFDFTESYQEEILFNLITNLSFCKRTEGLLKPEYFSNMASGKIADICIEFFSLYKQPIEVKALIQEIKDQYDAKKIREELRDLIKEKLGIVLKGNITIASDKLVDSIANFAKHQAVRKAFEDCINKLETGDFEFIDKSINAALNVGATSQFEVYNYKEKLSERIKQRNDILAGVTGRLGITTGIIDLDNCLRSKGWAKKELSLIMGGAKSGKTMGLAFFATNSVLSGKNTLYVTLEVSPEIIAERCDANLSDIRINDLSADLATITKAEAEIKRRLDGAGNFDIQEFPSGTMRPSDLRRLIEKRQAEVGYKFDAVFVDYADIMAPDKKYAEKKDQLGSIYVDLRAIAQIYDVAIITATQTNREGMKSKVADMTHVAEDISKVRTADIIISINVTDEEKMSNEARLFFAASRTGEDSITLRVKRDISKAKFITQVLGRA